MSAIKKIMVPTDFSEAAERAMSYVAELTKGYPDKTVTFMHVTDQNDPMVEEKLAQFEAQFGALSDASCATVIRTGASSDEILRYQDEHPQDLIIMGTEGREGELFSYGADVALNADFPVLIIPKSTKRAGEIKNIALALDKNAIDNSSSLGVLHSLAREKDAKVHVLTIETEENGNYIGTEVSESILEYYLETLDWKYVFPKNKDIEKGIMEYVEKNEIDILAVLPHNHATRNSPSEGKLTRLLALHSKVPVLAID